MAASAGGALREILVEADPEALSLEAAVLFKKAVLESVEQKGRFAAALSGGTTPKKLYELLSREPHVSELPWEKTHLFFGDERSVPPDNPDSNFRMVKETLLSKITIPARNVHRMKGELEPEEAALAYEKELREFFKPAEKPDFDLILLGLGTDGHIASLFPETSALNEKERWVRAHFVEAVKMFRITLTLPALNSANRILFLVCGKEKAMMVRRVLEGPLELPAQLIQPESGKLFWLLDEEAAQLLQGPGSLS